MCFCLFRLLQDRGSRVLELVHEGEADASSLLTREMYRCLRGDRKSTSFNGGASTSGVHGTPPPHLERPLVSTRKSTSSQPPHGSRGSHTLEFSVGPSQSRDDDPDVEIPLIVLRDETPPMPRPVRPNTSASAVPSDTGGADRSTHPTGSGQVARPERSKDRVGTKKRARSNRNQNSASRIEDPGRAPASPSSSKSD